MPDSSPLDFFGEFVIRNLRDAAIGHFERLAQGEIKAPALLRLQRELADLSEEQRSLVRRCVLDSIDSGIHDFLFKIQEQVDFENRLGISVDSQDVISQSDGLHGELFTEDGWFARFSEHGEPPEEA